jgi:uncharacterized membrane protein (UPF0127 family)
MAPARPSFKFAQRNCAAAAGGLNSPMAKLGYWLLGVVFAAVLVFSPTAPRAQSLQIFAKSSVTVITKSGKHDFDVEVAETESQRQQGLMFRREMAADAGMLFDYEVPQRASMWMKNTLIPLDMLFIDRDGRITHIAERTIPGSLSVIPSRGKILGVFEVNAGTVARLGIAPGDTVVHKIFGNAE